jgi:hypothetical protein
LIAVTSVSNLEFEKFKFDFKDFKFLSGCGKTYQAHLLGSEPARPGYEGRSSGQYSNLNSGNQVEFKMPDDRMGQDASLGAMRMAWS